MITMQIIGLDYSYTAEIGEYFNPLLLKHKSEVPSASAFCQARIKIKHNVFIDLNATLLESYYSSVEVKDWHGFRVVAIDGSTVHVPDTEENRIYFGGWDAFNGNWNICPKARISFAYDPLNKLIIDAQMSPISTGEDTHAILHFDQSSEDDLNIYDRGYASFRLFKEHEHRDLHYCARLPTELFTTICDPFIASDETDVIIEYSPSSPSRKQCKDAGLTTENIKMRLIKVILPTGEIEVLATNVFDERLTVKSFDKLYQLRWGVEEEYKRLKSRTELEDYSGKKLEFVYQDFFADVVRLNLSSLMAAEARDKLKLKVRKKKYHHAPNMSYTLGKLSNFIRIMKDTNVETWNLFLDNLTDSLCRFSLPVRPGRKVPRVKKPLRSGYSAPYKRAS